MRYDIEIVNREGINEPMVANLTEKGQGTVARITEAPRPLDPQRGAYDLQWMNSAAKKRFIEYALVQQCPALDEATMAGIEITREYAIVAQRDNLVANLLDLENMRYYKTLAQKNTLYFLNDDPSGDIRIAPNPNNNLMRKSLDVVFGENVAVIVNDTLPADPQDEYSFVEPEDTVGQKH
jgi:hypothetical protein